MWQSGTSLIPTMRFGRFADETPLHGFGIAARSANLADLVGWLAMVFICSVMTIQQTAQLIKLYNTEPTAVAVTWQTGDDLVLDQLVISIPYYQYWQPPYTYTEIDASEIRQLLQETNMTELLLQSFPYTTTMEWPLINYFLSMFNSITAAESRVMYGWPKQYLTWYAFNSDTDIQELNPLSYLQSYLYENNFSLLSTLKMTLSQICVRMVLNCYNSYTDAKYFKANTTDAKKISTNCSEIMCHPDNVVYFGDGTMAFQLSTKARPVTFAAMVDLFRIDFNARAAFNSSSNQINSNFQLFFDGKSYVDQDTNHLENKLDAKLGSFSCIGVGTRAAYRFLSLSRKPCSDKMSAFECENRCWGDLIKSNCSCWPLQKFPWKPTDTNLSYCGEGVSLQNTTIIPHLESCDDFRSDLPMLVDVCASKCNGDCESREFAFTTKTNNEYCYPNNRSTDSADGTTSLLLFVDNFSYSYIEESLLKDWQTFLNEFGGLIGIWLGGSLIAFVHIPIFLIKLGYTQFKKRVHLKSLKVAPRKISGLSLVGKDMKATAPTSNELYDHREI